MPLWDIEDDDDDDVMPDGKFEDGLVTELTCPDCGADMIDGKQYHEFPEVRK
jgi:rubredoxin